MGDATGPRVMKHSKIKKIKKKGKTMTSRRTDPGRIGACKRRTKRSVEGDFPKLGTMPDQNGKSFRFKRGLWRNSYILEPLFFARQIFIYTRCLSKKLTHSKQAVSLDKALCANASLLKKNNNCITVRESFIKKKLSG